MMSITYFKVKMSTALISGFILILLISYCLALSGIYYDNGVDKTVVDKQLTKQEKTEMQHEILDLLGLQHRPRPTLFMPKSRLRNARVLNSAPRFLMDVYQSLTEEDSGDLKLQPELIEREFNVSQHDVTAMEEADIIMSFINHGRFFDGVANYRGEGRFWFDMSEVPSLAAVMTAELRLFLNHSQPEAATFQPEDDDEDLVGEDAPPRETSNDEGFILTLYQIFQGRREGDLAYVDSIEIDQFQEGWIALNVSSTLAHWLEKPEENFGLQLVCRTLSGRQVSSAQAGVVGSHGDDKLQPFMVAFFRSTASEVPQTKSNEHNQLIDESDLEEEDLSTPKNRRRVRRQTSNKKRSKDNANNEEQAGWSPFSDFDARYAKRSCQKKNLYVSFRDLDWHDWIIAPDGYAAFYCNGECSFPLNAHMNASNHAIVQTLVHLMNPYRVPKPCCAPIKLSSISVLYFDDNANVILKKYRNMVVKSCGCH